MKRYLNLTTMMVLLGLVLVLAACGTDDAGDDADADDEQTDSGDSGADTDGEDEGAEGDDEGDDDAAGDIDPETYYEGATIRFVTSSGAGGGTDTKIRTLASQLSRFIPGNPAIQVSNVTPHVAGMNFVWNAEPDGLTVLMTAAPTLEFEFFEGAEWNSADWAHVGTMDAVCDNMFIVRGDTGYETIEDAMGGSEPLISMTQAPSPADVEPVALGEMLMAEYLDLPLELRRVAESGTAALNLALERGEINAARYGADWCRMPDANPGWLEDGFVIPLLDVATSGPDAQMAAGVEDRGERPPHISELISEEQYAEFTGLVSASRAGGNPILLPPETPDEIANILRDAFDAAVADEDFVDAMMTAFGGSEIRFNDAEATNELFTRNLELMSEYQDQFAERTDELYSKYVK